MSKPTYAEYLAFLKKNNIVLEQMNEIEPSTKNRYAMIYYMCFGKDKSEKLVKDIILKILNMIKNDNEDNNYDTLDALNDLKKIIGQEEFIKVFQSI